MSEKFSNETRKSKQTNKKKKNQKSKGCTNRIKLLHAFVRGYCESLTLQVMQTRGELLDANQHMAGHNVGQWSVR